MTDNLPEVIQQRLKETFEPIYLKLIDESHQHRTTKGNKRHFKLILASEKFSDLKAIQRQRAVNQCLADLFDQGIHALSMKLFDPKQWKANPLITSSPPCRGGGAK